MFTISGCCPFPDVSSPPFPRACSPCGQDAIAPRIRCVHSLAYAYGRPRNYVKPRNNNLSQEHQHPSKCSSSRSSDIQVFQVSRREPSRPHTQAPTTNNSDARVISLAPQASSLAPYISFLPRTTPVLPCLIALTLRRGSRKRSPEDYVKASPCHAGRTTYGFTLP